MCVCILSRLCVCLVCLCVCVGQVLPTLCGPNVHTMMIKLKITLSVGTTQTSSQGKQLNKTQKIISLLTHPDVVPNQRYFEELFSCFCPTKGKVSGINCFWTSLTLDAVTFIIVRQSISIVHGQNQVISIVFSAVWNFDFASASSRICSVYQQKAVWFEIDFIIYCCTIDLYIFTVLTKNTLRHFSKYLILCFTEERKVWNNSE